MDSYIVSKLFASLRHFGFLPTVSNIIRTIEKNLITQIHRTNRDKYLQYIGTTDAALDKVIWVDPSKIIHETYTYFGDQLSEHGKVYDGRWDKIYAEFKNRIEFESLQRHFCEHVPWENTSYYIHAKSCITSGRGFRGFSTINDVERFFDHIDRVYQRIRNDGYRSQRDLLQDIEANEGDATEAMDFGLMNEIGVNITRNGKILWHTKGQHRLIIAKLLNLEKVPVQICTRHAEWQQIRNRIRTSSNEELNAITLDCYQTHPDLIDILTKHS